MKRVCVLVCSVFFNFIMNANPISVTSRADSDADGIFIEVVIANVSDSNIMFFEQNLPWVDIEETVCFVEFPSGWITDRPKFRTFGSYFSTHMIMPGEEISGRFYLKRIFTNKLYERLMKLSVFSLTWAWNGHLFINPYSPQSELIRVSGGGLIRYERTVERGHP